MDCLSLLASCAISFELSTTPSIELLVCSEEANVSSTPAADSSEIAAIFSTAAFTVLLLFVMHYIRVQ